MNNISGAVAVILDWWRRAELESAQQRSGRAAAGWRVCPTGTPRDEFYGLRQTAMVMESWCYSSSHLSYHTFPKQKSTFCPKYDWFVCSQVVSQILLQPLVQIWSCPDDRKQDKQDVDGRHEASKVSPHTRQSRYIHSLYTVYEKTVWDTDAASNDKRPCSFCFVCLCTFDLNMCR